MQHHQPPPQGPLHLPTLILAIDSVPGLLFPPKTVKLVLIIYLSIGASSDAGTGHPMRAFCFPPPSPEAYHTAPQFPWLPVAELGVTFDLAVCMDGTRT